MSDISDVIVVGGGAAGMMAAISAAEYGANVTIIEKNSRMGRKLAITGKGRCNVTNNSAPEEVLKNIPRNPNFMYGALSRFTPEDVMAFFEELGVPLKTERGKRVFPVSDKAGDIVSALEKRLGELGVKILRDEVRSLVIKDGECLGAKTRRGEYRGAVILATGGMSYPVTGSDGFGYTLAKSAGHTIVPPEPSLSAMVTRQRWVSRAAGLNLRNIAVRLFDGDKAVYDDFGELLFTEYGISGPTVLSASAHIPHMESGRYKITIDLKPALTEKQLDARILRDFSERHGKPFGESIGGLLPRQLLGIFPELLGIPSEKKVDEITKEERRRLVALLKNLTLDIEKFRPIDEAIITRGGVSVKEIPRKQWKAGSAKGFFSRERSSTSTPIPAALICKSLFPRAELRDIPPQAADFRSNS